MADILHNVTQFITSLFTAASLHTAPVSAPANLPVPHAVPGGIAVVGIGNSPVAPEVTFNGRRVMVVSSGEDHGWQALVGIPLSQPVGDAAVSAAGKHYHFTVRDKAYPEQHLTVQKNHVNPSAGELSRIRREMKTMLAVYNSFTTDGSWQPMQWPVKGPLSSAFGLKRFFNGEQRNPHSGLDIAAPKGADVIAPAGGRVVLTGNFFFNGNSVFIDHGQGLISMFCHLDSIRVQEGQQVQSGDLLGQVGATGRATGPHLHWTVSLNNARINPMLTLAPPSSFAAGFTARTAAAGEFHGQ